MLIYCLILQVAEKENTAPLLKFLMKKPTERSTTDLTRARTRGTLLTGRTSPTPANKSPTPAKTGLRRASARGMLKTGRTKQPNNNTMPAKKGPTRKRSRAVPAKRSKTRRSRRRTSVTLRKKKVNNALLRSWAYFVLSMGPVIIFL